MSSGKRNHQQKTDKDRRDYVCQIEKENTSPTTHEGFDFEPSDRGRVEPFLTTVSPQAPKRRLGLFRNLTREQIAECVAALLLIPALVYSVKGVFCLGVEFGHMEKGVASIERGVEKNADVNQAQDVAIKGTQIRLENTQEDVSDNKALLMKVVTQSGAE